ncbi:hypothetical protein MCEMOHM34_00741 [Candidatus Methylopumilus universalis]|uniref:hypothetical protein n=1 Tax=Candidatus Methylopumilus universalis TaxID=2588536 RepID=UPI003BEEB367
MQINLYCKFIFGILFIFLLSFNAYADGPAERKGVATTIFTSGSKPSDNEIKEAQDKAVAAAWDSYTAEFNSSKMKQYMLVKDDIKKNMKDYLISFVLIENQVNKDSKTITSIVKVKINESALDSKLSILSAAGQRASGEGSTIAFIFMVRQLDSTTVFKDKETSITQKKTAKKSTDSMKGDTDSLATDSFDKTTSGGSIEKKSATLKYRLLNNSVSSKDIESSMNSVLSPNGFEVSSYDDIVAECGGTPRNKIEKEFIETNDMSVETRKIVIKASRDCEVKFFSIATLDVGVSEKDSAGNQSIVVSVRADVDNIEKKLPKKVASIGPLQARGSGSDEQSAAREAIKNAAVEAAKVIVDQLNAKGLN